MPMGLPKSGTDDLFSHWDATLATPAWVALTNLVTVTPTATGNIRGDKIRIFHAQMQKSGSWNGANGAGAKFLSHARITSYNVCYTKLLRAIGPIDRHPTRVQSEGCAGHHGRLRRQ